jgi:2Fe-2S ferredoxin
MPRVTYVHLNGERETLDVADGTSVMQAARAGGIVGIVAECGGSLMCATCHVYVEEGFLELAPPVSEEEDEMLEFTASGRKPNSRLSCQLVMSDALDGIVVHIPEEQAV